MYPRSSHQENDPVSSVLTLVVTTLHPGLLPLTPRVRAGESISARALRDHCPARRTQKWSSLASEEGKCFSVAPLGRGEVGLQHWSPLDLDSVLCLKQEARCFGEVGMGLASSWFPDHGQGERESALPHYKAKGHSWSILDPSQLNLDLGPDPLLNVFLFF